MIEFLYDCIRATADDDTPIVAKITNNDGECITEACHLMLYDNEDNLVAEVMGNFTDDIWEFVIPQETAKGFRGRYFYCICDHHSGNRYCFKQPIYFV